jgi:hypothetical protein
MKPAHSYPQLSYREGFCRPWQSHYRAAAEPSRRKQ